VKFPIANCQLPASRRPVGAFTLLEVLVVVSLLSLIVLALMQVFSSTQRAFRAAATQADVLEGSRAAMDLIASDLHNMTPSGGVSNGAVNLTVGPIYHNYSPFLQSLPGSYPVAQRTNVLNYFFSLSRENTKWIGIGYAVDAADASPLFSLYRYYNSTNLTADPRTLFNDFTNQVFSGRWTNSSLSHILDGVVHLTLRAYDKNGYWLNTFYPTAYAPMFVPYSGQSAYGETAFYMYSNAVPAAVELELGVLEDQVLARASSLPFPSAVQSNYLAGQSGAVHVFRQRVTIPNVDRTAYP
jgi:type II secretory pathway pseudopilin PulG